MKFDQKIGALDTKFAQRIDTLQYWYWETLAAICLSTLNVVSDHAVVVFPIS